MSSEPPRRISIKIDEKCYEISRTTDRVVEIVEDGIAIAIVHRDAPKSREVGREALLRIIDSIHDAYGRMVQAILGGRGDC